MKPSLLFALPVCLIGFTDRAVLSADQKAQSEFEFLIRGMLAARENFRSGEARIKGTKLATHREGSPLDGKVKGVYRFDAATGSFLFEWEVPCKLNLQSPGNHSLPEPGQHGTQYNVKYWACRNPEYFAHVGDIPDSNPRVIFGLDLWHPEFDFRENGASCQRRPFDPLAAGIIGYFEFLKGEPAADVYGGMLSKTLESYESDGPIVTIVLKDKVARHTLLADKQRMVPLSLTSRSLTDPSVFTSKSEWKVIDDVPIPVTLTAHLAVPELADVVDQYQFHWSRINEPFDASEFEYTAFSSIPPNLFNVTDYRGDEAEYLGRWYADNTIEKPIDRARRAAPGEELGSEPQRNNWLRIVVGVNIFALVALLLFGLFRAKRASKREKGSR